MRGQGSFLVNWASVLLRTRAWCDVFTCSTDRLRPFRAALPQVTAHRAVNSRATLEMALAKGALDAARTPADRTGPVHGAVLTPHGAFRTPCYDEGARRRQRDRWQ